MEQLFIVKESKDNQRIINNYMIKIKAFHGFYEELLVLKKYNKK